jgi:hypothetical protein
MSSCVGVTLKLDQSAGGIALRFRMTYILQDRRKGIAFSYYAFYQSMQTFTLFFDMSVVISQSCPLWSDANNIDLSQSPIFLQHPQNHQQLNRHTLYPLLLPLYLHPFSGHKSSSIRNFSLPSNLPDAPRPKVSLIQILIYHSHLFWRQL